jgi:sulfotransferase family protein
MKRIRVLIYGLPKSGTTLLTYKISNALGESTQIIFEPKSRDRKIENPNHIVTKCLFGLNSQAYATPATIREYDDYEKKIWIARDPRDVVISNFLYQWYLGHKPKEESFKRAFESVLQKEDRPSSVQLNELERIKINGAIFSSSDVKNYHKSMSDSICQMINSLGSNWYIYKYEDLIDYNCKRLNEYLGFDLDYEADVPEELGRVKRSKAYGNWRDWFTKEDVEFYKPLFNEYMQLMNYDTNDWDLNNNPILEPKLGSGYMEKLFYNKNS